MTVPDTITALRQVGATRRDHVSYERVTRWTVEFDREPTREEFGAWLAEQGWLGYHPAGYSGHWAVKGRCGFYTHGFSCD